MPAEPSSGAPVTEVAMIQMACGARRDDNVALALQYIGRAAAAGANIVCLQELFATVYPCQSEDHSRFAWAESIPGPTYDSLQRAAARHGVVLVGSLFERRAPGLYHNTAVVFDADGQYLGCYRKMHVPDDPCYYEKFYFTPGDLGFRCFDTRCGRIAVGICWDQWFPEAARAMTLAGAEAILYPTAIGWVADEKDAYGQSQYEAWETMLRSHAIANGVFVGAANRVGTEDALEFWGGSVLIDPYGTILRRGTHAEPGIVTAGCRRALVDTARTHWPFLRDRRIDAYQDLARRWQD